MPQLANTTPKRLPRNILLVVMGGIAAYKTPLLCRLLRRSGFDLRVIMTKNAARFVARESLAQASEASVCVEMFDDADHSANMLHISLARWAHIVLIAPASANGLARIANGLCDDLSSTTVLALQPNVAIFAAPAMNPQMWQNPATVHNTALLQARGVKFIGPCLGPTACGEVGLGRMSEPQEIVTLIEHARVNINLLENVRILITAGPTLEAIDPVRFISNRSSGRQGYALAQAFAERGAQVVLVAGASLLPPPSSPRIRAIRVESAAEMAQVCLDELNNGLKNSKPLQVAIFAAAVSDFHPKENHSHKLPKKALSGKIELVANKDILAEVANLPRSKRPQLVIGFAAQTEITEKGLAEKQHAKICTKNCDWLIANDVLRDSVFNSEFNRVRILEKNGQVEALPKMTKRAVANRIAEKVAAYLDGSLARSLSKDTRAQKTEKS